MFHATCLAPHTAVTMRSLGDLEPTTPLAQFAETRRGAGVRAQRIQRPVVDPHYVMIDLDFDDIASAAAFRNFLTTVVWAVPENAPALVGTPTTVLLEALPG